MDGRSILIRPDKPTLLEALRSRVEQQLRTLRDSQNAAQEGAVHEETRQEDPKDTRAIEAQYIARGFSERVEGLTDALAELTRLRLDEFGPEDPIALSALVGLKDGNDERIYFIVPVAGGETLSVGGATVLTLTPASPLGQALLGQQVDDDVELQLPRRRLAAIVDWIC